jgi:hypothetical protein
MKLDAIINSPIRINPHELRLGNLVYGKGRKMVRNSYMVRAVKNWAHQTVMGYAAITITDEWLKVFGFKEIDIWWELHHKNGSIIMVDKPDLIVCVDSYGSYSQDVAQLEHIKYIHQLQNLYYAITGEELKYAAIDL